MMDDVEQSRPTTTNSVVAAATGDTPPKVVVGDGGGASSGDYVAMATLEMEPSASSSMSNHHNNNMAASTTPKNKNQVQQAHHQQQSPAAGGDDDDRHSDETNKSYRYSHLFTEEIERTLVQICYLSVFAILGSFLRIVIAQLFGDECAHPNTVGWLAASSPLCITKQGNATFEGGIIFADLPSNLLGSFIMGMLQNGDTLGLPINCQLAFVNPTHVLQTMPIIQLALRTGFCGSLTTYSSWNSEMIVMIFGTGDEDKYGKQVHFLNELIKALFGYLIGVETALGSFEFGKTVALWCNKCADPLLHDEMIALRERKEEGVYHNKKLPNFERRFLPNLNMDTLGGSSSSSSELLYSTDMIEYLERWRRSTINVRRVRHPLLSTLIEIESSLLIDQTKGGGQPLLPIHVENENIARSNGWDIDSLKQWVQYKSTLNMNNSTTTTTTAAAKHNNNITTTSSSLLLTTNGGCCSTSTTNNNSHHHDAYKFETLPVAITILGLIVSLAILCIVVFNKNTPYDITDRTTCYAILFGPFGAILRWQLSKLNGSLKNISWFPLGTFTANFVASCISVFTVAIEYRIGNNFDGFWAVGTLRGIRIGFSGCLSTVSTFVSEVAGLKKKGRAYTYVVISLASTCIVGCGIYGLVISLFQE